MVCGGVLWRFFVVVVCGGILSWLISGGGLWWLREVGKPRTESVLCNEIFF